MSERDYAAEAAEIAAWLGVEHKPDASDRVIGWFIGGGWLLATDPIWDALLRLARAPRAALPDTVPDGHERVRIGLWRTVSGNWASGVEGYPWSREELADAVVIADVPMPKPVEIVGSVDP